MLSIFLGPVALPAPVLLLLAVWGASWPAERIASSGIDKVYRIIPTVGHY